jgi:hypothetical protein
MAYGLPVYRNQRVEERCTQSGLLIWKICRNVVHIYAITERETVETMARKTEILRLNSQTRIPARKRQRG